MILIPYYFFMALFLGFFFLYVFKNDHHVILKNKKCDSNDKNCYSIN